MDIKKINWSCKEMFWLKSWCSQVKYAVNRVWHLRSQKALRAKLQLHACKSLGCVVVYHCHLYKQMIEFTSVKAHLCLVCIQLAHTAEVCMHICIFYHFLAEKAVLKIVPEKQMSFFKNLVLSSTQQKQKTPIQCHRYNLIYFQEWHQNKITQFKIKQTRCQATCRCSSVFASFFVPFNWQWSSS